MEAIPAGFFRSQDAESGENPETVLALATLMGDVAAQNMAMKKFDPRTESPLYGVGKEIYAFEHDIVRGRMMPKSVSICSIRGSFGWPSLEHTEENLDRIADFYLGHFVCALKAFQAHHPSVTLADAANRFMEGFEFRMREMAWKLVIMRDRFEAFDPDVPARYGFRRRWEFVMWSPPRAGPALPPQAILRESKGRGERNLSRTEGPYHSDRITRASKPT